MTTHKVLRACANFAKRQDLCRYQSAMISSGSVVGCRGMTRARSMFMNTYKNSWVQMYAVIDTRNLNVIWVSPNKVQCIKIANRVTDGEKQINKEVCDVRYN